MEVAGQVDSLVHDSSLVLALRHHCNKSKLDIIRTLGNQVLSVDEREKER